MDDNKCCNICGTLTIDGDMSATMSVGTIVARDGTDDYNELVNKPSIEDRVLEGNKTFEDLGIRPMTIQEVERILYLG